MRSQMSLIMDQLEPEHPGLFALEFGNIAESDFVYTLSSTTGLPGVREKSKKLNFFQGQGIAREFCKPSGKFENIGKCQGVIRKFWGKK